MKFLSAVRNSLFSVKQLKKMCNKRLSTFPEQEIHEIPYINPVFDEIHRHLIDGTADDPFLSKVSRYYFDGQGKSIRPKLTEFMADAVNCHLGLENDDRRNISKLREKQRAISLISEMYHTASLVHDDVIDRADLRRGQQSLNNRWGQRNSIWAGDFIVAISNKILGQLRDPLVTIEMSQILRQLVIGELQQMSKVREDKVDRYQQYLLKTFNKTASLMAHSCRSVAILSVREYSYDRADVVENAFNFGKNIGIAFQLIDDWLDFQASADDLGKPSRAADLRLGLATAPVLFAAEHHPELNLMIQRKFSNPGDVDSAFRMVLDSRGLFETRLLALNYSQAALSNISGWKSSAAKHELKELAQSVIERSH